MKTIADYLNDSRLLNDPQMSGALEPVREIHAARLMLQDETAEMTMAERTAYHKQSVAALFADIGLPPPQYVDFTGRGKMKSRTAVDV